MKTYVRKGWFRISLPPGWTVDEKRDPLAIYHPEGAGALEISSVAPRPLKAGERIDPFLMLRALLRGAGVDIADTDAQRYAGGGIEWAACDHDEEDREHGLLASRAWIATNHEACVYLTYSCRDEDRNLERGEIDAIVGSLELM